MSTGIFHCRISPPNSENIRAARENCVYFLTQKLEDEQGRELVMSYSVGVEDNVVHGCAFALLEDTHRAYVNEEFVVRASGVKSKSEIIDEFRPLVGAIIKKHNSSDFVYEIVEDYGYNNGKREAIFYGRRVQCFEDSAT